MPSSKRSSAKTLQWLSLLGVIWLQSISGTNTDFPAYSSELKASFSISQLQLNNLSFASDTGKLFGYFSGLAALHLPLWLVLSVGSSLGLLGYGLQYLSLVQTVPKLAYWQLFSLTVLAGNSICWINTVSYVVTIRNFPARFRQVAVGITTSYQGLSAKIYTDAAAAGLLSPSGSKVYLLLNSLLPAVVCAVVMPFVRGVSDGADDDDDGNSNSSRMEAGFVALFALTVATGVYSVVTSLGFGSGNVAGTAAFLAAALVIPAGEKLREVLERYASGSGEKRVYSVEVEEGGGGREELGGGGDKMEGDVAGVREEIGVREMVKRVDFWLYFSAYLGSATVGLVYLNNLGQIAESRGCSRTASLVSLSASFGFFGRLMPALLDYHFSRSKYVVSKPGMIAILVAPMAGALFLLLDSTDLSLYVGTAVIGVCTGAITSISVSMTSELFGSENFSVNHNVLVANIPLGSFIFGYLAAILYSREGKGSSDGKCMGSECYRTTFLIWGSICFIGTFLALILHVRTKKFYSNR